MPGQGPAYLLPPPFLLLFPLGFWPRLKYSKGTGQILLPDSCFKTSEYGNTAWLVGWGTTEVKDKLGGRRDTAQSHGLLGSPAGGLQAKLVAQWSLQ